DFYFEEGMPEAGRMVEFIDQVQQEDIVICESVQRGLESGFYEQGRLMTRYEVGIQHFERLGFEALTRNDPSLPPGCPGSGAAEVGAREGSGGAGRPPMPFRSGRPRRGVEMPGRFVRGGAEAGSHDRVRSRCRTEAHG